MKTLRPAFTIIEILISVIIITLAIIPVLKVHTENQKQIVYISERNKRSLEDSLYLSHNILMHHQDNKTAYEVLEKFFRIKEFKSREILKESSRDVFLPEEMKILSLGEQGGPSAIVNEIMLKGKHPSRYYHFNLEGF
ncbi:MAG: hypothetical protein EP216_02030 [Epsilonproteobacteria bacterium]|nr:MAG: hypothetical protein EP216_02030 [Campylobacterota bacterium]